MGSGAPPQLEPTVTRVAIEIDYARGAEPYVDAGALEDEPFDLAEANLARLFQGLELDLPRTLDEMEELEGLPEGPYSPEDIVALAAAHRAPPEDPSVGSFYVIWLEGTYFDPRLDAENPNVLGVSIGGTSVVALFKPVIRSSEGPVLLGSAPFVEQATLIHEIGHAAGLVNGGLPLVSEHQDEEHGAHCDDPDCVMYYLNEGVDSVRDFVTRIGAGETPILFDDACLADVDAARSSSGD